MVVTDLYTKWPEGAATGDTTSPKIIEILLGMCARWGYPEEVISDNRAQFVSGQFEDFLAKHDIKHCRTAYYNPTANSNVERFNQVLKKGLTMNLQVGKSITAALTTILFMYRNTRHPFTGKTPAEMMLGWSPRTALDQFRVCRTKNRNSRNGDSASSKFAVRRHRSVQHIQPGD